VSILQTPTTLKNEFGSAPTRSLEKSILTGCAAAASHSDARRLAAVIATTRTRLLTVIVVLHSWRSARECAARGGSTTTTRPQSPTEELQSTRAGRSIHPRLGDNCAAIIVLVMADDEPLRHAFDPSRVAGQWFHRVRHVQLLNPLNCRSHENSARRCTTGADARVHAQR